MTIDEAILILTGELEPRSTPTLALWEVAVTLGLEALSRIKAQREGKHFGVKAPLPFETKEAK